MHKSARFVALLGLIAVALSGCSLPESISRAIETSSSAAPEPTQSTSSPMPNPTVTVTETVEATEDSEPATTTAPEENEVTSQTIDYYISGGCQESYDILDYYAIFEEYADDCYLEVAVFPAEPSRLVSLQFFEDTWTTEISAYTDSYGEAVLEVSPYCEGGQWCDGIWEYRVFVTADHGLPSDQSITFELDFIPEG